MGVVLLMFSLGLEFSLRKLTRVGMAALVASLLEILLMIWLGYEVGRAFGWNTMDSVFLGAMLSISSTTIIVKALAELGKSKEAFAEIIFGILVIEDILAIILLALLSGFAKTGSLSASQVGLEIVKLSVFFAVVLVAGFIFVPRLFDYIAKFKSDEMLLVGALGFCFGVALVASMLGYSVALGAFLIGAVIAESRQIHKIEDLTAPVRDMFSAIFFVTIGMLIDPKMLLQYAWPIIVLSLLVIVGKVITCSFGVFIGGKDLRTSLSVGLGLAQIGEFSFIIATLGLTLNVTSAFLYPIAVAVSVITTLTTPYLIRSTDGVAQWIHRAAPRPMMQALDVYTAWIGSFGQQDRSPMVLLVRRMGWQLLINLLLTMAVFALGAWIADWDEYYVHLPEPIRAPEVYDCLCWLGVMMFTAPIYLASWRKIQAMSMMIAEVCVPIGDGGSARRGGAIGHRAGVCSRVRFGHDRPDGDPEHVDPRLAREHGAAADSRDYGGASFPPHSRASLQPRGNRAARDVARAPPNAPSAQGDAGVAARGGTRDDGDSARLRDDRPQAAGDSAAAAKPAPASSRSSAPASV